MKLLKTILLAGTLFSVNMLAHAQSSSLGKIGFTFSTFDDTDLVYTENIVGSADYDGTRFKSIGLSYLHPLNHWLELETGINYSDIRVERRMYNVPHNVLLQPGEAFLADLSLLDIPITLRGNFLNYFFAQGGLFMGIDLTDSEYIDDQTGLGGMLGLGAKYDFNIGLSVFVNPYIKMHTILPTTTSDNPQQHLLHSAVRFGISYQL